MDQEIKISGYENIYVDCPSCNHENIYNRVSDLKSTKPIARYNGLICQKCGGTFSTLNDEITFADYYWFLRELKQLKENKSYRLYILTLCQGCECFFREAIINKIFDRNPKYRDERGKLLYLNYKKAKKLFWEKEFLKMSFFELRKKFIDIYIDELSNPTERINLMRENLLDMSVNIINMTDINKMRNRVVHKEAYRPSLVELENYNSLIDTIYWLGMYLQIRHSDYLVNNIIEK